MFSEKKSNPPIYIYAADWSYYAAWYNPRLELLHDSRAVSVGLKCRLLYLRLQDQASPTTFFAAEWYWGMGPLRGMLQSRGSFGHIRFSWTRSVSHYHFENVITFSLQLGIRHMNSRFEAYELNFHNPSEGLPDCVCVHSRGAFEYSLRSCFFTKSIPTDTYFSA